MLILNKGIINLNYTKVLVVLLLCCLSLPLFAASRRYTTALHIDATTQTTATESQLRAFEQQLLPYFQERANRTFSDTSTVYIPSQGDYFLIARYWKRLSSSFITQYQQALSIPPSFLNYVSPGGHFEIYYTDTGSNGVDMTDTIGYSTSNWRTKTHTANNVPDYVDMVAWALDSSWSMEIDRFGFKEPLPFIDATHTSSRYKVVITQPTNPFDYGVTQPMSDSSYIIIRNEWKNKQIWIDTLQQPYMDYVHHPDRGINVTAAHEFFHSIQFAMNMSNFPLSWIEGTSVLMESLGFDTVRDYIQYSRDYFSRPDTTILNDAPDNTPYVTGLLTKYVYEKSLDTPSIAFVKKIFFNNYNASINFQKNLETTAQSFGKRWRDILGSFYAASYFTGTRAKQGVFLKDAPILNMWPVSNVVAPVQKSPVNNASSVTLPMHFSWSSNSPVMNQIKTVRPYGMNWFSFYRTANQGDSISMSFTNNSAIAGLLDTCWSIQCIINYTDSLLDTIISLPLNSSKTAHIKIPNSSSAYRVIGVVSKTDPTSTSDVHYVFNPSTVVPPAATQRLQISPASSFASLTIDTVVFDSSLTINTLAPYTAYYWRTGSMYVQSTVWSSKQTFTTLSEVAKLVAYPNPGSIKDNSAIIFEGDSIIEISIYNISSHLIAHAVRNEDNSSQLLQTPLGFSWQFRNSNVVPGLYNCIISTKDRVTKGLSKTRKKLIIRP